MSLLYNNYQKICQDNKDENAKLKPENRKSIERMTDYLSLNNVSLFELEVIKKDLIGIATEAELEELTFADKLGMKEKEFCDSLLHGAMKNRRFESLLILAKKLAIFTAAATVYFYITTGFPEKYGLVTSICVFVSFLVLLFEALGLDKAFKKKFIYNDYVESNRKMIFTVIAILIIWKLDFGKLFGISNVAFIYGNGTVISIVSVVVAIALFLANNYYWDKQSKKYDWQ